jgi:hypothetical protein
MIIAATTLATAGVIAAVVLLAHPFHHTELTAANAVSSRHAVAPKTVTSASAAPSQSSSATPSATSSVTEQQAATSLAALLEESGSDRQAVNDAYNDVSQCGSSLAADAQTFTDAASSRQQLLKELSQVPGLATLPTAMVSDLTTGWQVSATVDSDYAKWAQDEEGNGCSTGLTDPNYEAADGPNLQATASKTAFVNRWNPLAGQYDLTTYTQGEI